MTITILVRADLERLHKTVFILNRIEFICSKALILCSCKLVNSIMLFKYLWLVEGLCCFFRVNCLYLGLYIDLVNILAVFTQKVSNNESSFRIFLSFLWS